MLEAMTNQHNPLFQSPAKPKSPPKKKKKDTNIFESED